LLASQVALRHRRYLKISQSAISPTILCTMYM
jgi:hypothetical protein